MNQTTILENSEQQEASQPKVGPGAELASQREARSWTVEQVATQLNLAPRQIHALETDNFTALPGMASVRGFIRSYAKLLKIDAEPLLAKIAIEVAAPLSEPVPMRRALPTPFSDDTRLRSMNGYGTTSKSTLFVLSAILLMVGLFAGYQMGWMPESMPLKVQSPESAPTSLPVVSSPEATTVATSDLTDTSKNTPAAVAAEPVNASASVTVKTDAVPVNIAPAVATPPGNTNVVSKDALVFKLREDSWIEVKRINGNGPNSILISRLIKAGSTEAVEVTEPVSVAIGNVAGVDVSLRGAPVDIKAGVKTNVARLNLK